MTDIITKQLMLVPAILTPKLIEQMVTWLNDPSVVIYSEQRHVEHTIESQIEYVKSVKHLKYIVAEELFIGTIAAHIDENNSVANVGILIGEKKEWGKGYGTEAWQAFTDHLLTTNIRKIEAGCMQSNRGMIKIFERTGMHFEGRLQAHFTLGDQFVDLTQWARFK